MSAIAIDGQPVFVTKQSLDEAVDKTPRRSNSKILGTVQLNGEQYFLFVSYTKSKVSYFLISPVKKRDRIKYEMGQQIDSVIIQDTGSLGKYYSEDYLLESVTLMRATGKIHKYGDYSIIETILENLKNAQMYKFRDSDVTEDSTVVDMGTTIKRFSAQDDNLLFEWESVDYFNYTSLLLRNSVIFLQLTPTTFNVPSKKLLYSEVQGTEKKTIARATLKTITYDVLCDYLDMSWYKKDGVLQKDYHSIKSVREFETMVFTPLVKAILKCKECGTVLDIGLDTETDGLGIYDLSAENEAKNHCVAIPISWVDDAGFVIFCDMEHFDNCSTEYVTKRLSELFAEDRSDRVVHYWDAGEEKTAVIPVSCFRLIGHNCPFDRRVFYGEGADVWFDDDTLQMGFDINPRTVRGNNKLKNITRKVFGHETPELTDILGKSNEDKYRELADEEVAIIYGCADADYTRQVFKYLRNLMGDYMYNRYKQQDVKLLNILAISEYYGMSVIQDKVLELAEQSWQNLEILKNAMYSYVGVYMDYTQKRIVLDNLLNTKAISAQEYETAVANIEIDPKAEYRFEMKASSLREVLFNILKYPICGYTDKGYAKVDKTAIKELLRKSRTNNNVSRKLLKSILVSGADYNTYLKLKNGSEKDKKRAAAMCLIDEDEFNSKEYPVALMVQKFSELNKEYTSYYKPIREQNMEGKIFKSYSMARIETRRIQNPGQTMKGNLKALVRSYSDDYYMLDFDMSQVEYRIMVSLAHFTAMIYKMNMPENDYHTETAALVNNIPAHTVSKKVRKQAKKVSFGVPYGLGEYSLCKDIFGEVNSETLFATRMLLYKWKESNQPIMALLEDARAQALTEWHISEELRNYMDAWKKDEHGNYVLDEEGKKVPIPVSKVENDFGFYRVFDISNVEQGPAADARRASGRYDAAEGVIRRAAGNYPIQSFAAEIFRIILTRFYDRCCKEGLKDKIIWHMLIHDELLCSVHKSVNPFLLYKIVKESCMITMKGHTKYFVGINIGDTWAECKDDAREAPVYFVDRMIKRYDAGEFDDYTWFEHPWEFIKPYREQYVEDRIGEVLRQIQPNIDDMPIDVPLILEKFDNYTVRAYVSDYAPNGEIPVSSKDDSFADWKFTKSLETWAINVFGEGKAIILPNGVETTITASTVEPAPELQDEFIDFAELFDDNLEGGDAEEYWDYDEDGIKETYELEEGLEADFNKEDELEFDFDNYGKCADVAELTITEKKFQYLQYINGQIVITVQSTGQANTLKYCLESEKSSKGARVIFKGPGIFERWEKIRADDLFAIDAKVAEVSNSMNRDYKNLNFLNGKLFIQIPSNNVIQKIRTCLAPYSGVGYSTVLQTQFGEVIPVSNISFKTDLSELDLKLSKIR